LPTSSMARTLLEPESGSPVATRLRKYGSA
jgi:hypothetical protein